ncbi:MAG: NAD(P)-dependent oxidoreductase [Verrucomicrobiaceae bacterium]|nr:MAG: NAD(P)-dependent oxidoreductase [Verrucomicrobiaceae bacterium]
MEDITQTRLRRAQSISGTSKGRPEFEFYPTPRNAVEALLAVEQFPGLVWEPACGDGAICKVLEDTGHTVVATDLIDRGYGEGGCDFFSEFRAVDHIITNPPYKLAEKFVRHSLTQANGKVAMLLKLQFLEGVKRKALFEKFPPKTVYVFTYRLKMNRDGEDKPESTSMLAFAWFVWEVGNLDQPIIRWL